MSNSKKKQLKEISTPSIVRHKCSTCLKEFEIGINTIEHISGKLFWFCNAHYPETEEKCQCCGCKIKFGSKASWHRIDKKLVTTCMKCWKIHHPNGLFPIKEIKNEFRNSEGSGVYSKSTNDGDSKAARIPSNGKSPKSKGKSVRTSKNTKRQHGESEEAELDRRISALRSTLRERKRQRSAKGKS